MSYALGIDIGTSGVRTAVLDAGGSVISTARAAHVVRAGHEVRAEDWWAAVAACLERQVAALRADGFDPLEIRHAAIDGTSGSMVLTGADLAPVTRGLLYNSKGFEAEAERIAAVAPEGHIGRGSASALARFLRLLSEGDGADWVMHQADFVLAQLTRRGGVSDQNNALKTGYDVEREGWPDWFGALGIEAGMLPQVLPVGAEVSHIDQEVAVRFGLSPKLMFHAGTTDSIAAFLASGACEVGDGVTSLGTTLVVKVLTSERIDDARLGLYSHRLGDMWLVGGASNTGGGVLLEHFTPEEIAALSGQIDPGTGSGLDYYPLARPGERFPVNDPDLAPRMTPRPEDNVLFLKGIFEGIARIEAECYGAIERLGGPPVGRVFTAGGGAANPVWTQMRARILERPVVRAKHAEASVGAARLAMGLI